MTTDFSPRRQPTAMRLADLPVEEQLRVRKSATAPHRLWQGRLNVETVERFLVESMALLGAARVKTWTAVLAERLTHVACGRSSAWSPPRLT